MFDLASREIEMNISDATRAAPLRSGAGVKFTTNNRYIRKPPRTHEYWREIVRHAVETNAAPSPELIRANKILTSWEAFLRIGEVTSFPVTTQISATDICDARCAFCVYSPSTTSDQLVSIKDIERLDWLKFVERFSPNAGLGEPLVHPGLIAMFDTVRRLAPYISMFMTTNGSQMPEPVARGIVRHIDRLNLSLNATRKESYETIMALPFGQTIDNLKRLADLRRARSAKPMQVTATFVAHRHVLDELVEAPALLRSLDIDRIYVFAMSIVRIPIPDRKLLGREDHIVNEGAKANEVFRQLEAECERHGVKLINNLPWVEESRDEPSGSSMVSSNGRPVRDISKEFQYATFEDHDPFCLRPWRMLKIDMDRSTLICNGGFARMPEFGFPSARDFHGPGQMWNHPFMQHVRKTRGTADQVPFCTLCLNADKRAPRNAERRQLAIGESRALLRRMDTEARSASYAGRLFRLPERLEEYEIATSEGIERPFEKPRSEFSDIETPTRSNYRWRVYGSGFSRAGRVLMFGAGTTGVAPFLGEVCERLTIADTDVRAVRRAARLCRSFGLPVDTATVYPRRRLPFDDESFERIWADGATLCAQDAGLWLDELRRVLTPAGGVYIANAPAMGAFLIRLIRDATPEERERMMALLDAGLSKQSAIQFMPARDLRLLLGRHGFGLGRASKVAKTYWTENTSLLSGLDGSALPALHRRYHSKDDSIDRPGLFELSVSFLATKKA